MSRTIPSDGDAISLVSVRWALCAALLLLAGCGPNGGQSTGDAGVASDAGTADAELPPCEPALEIQPAKVTTAPGEFTRFEVSGGTGDYAFDYDNKSGGAFTSETGLYTAGPRIGKTDTIRVSDRGCNGSAKASIEIQSMQVRPTEVMLAPNNSFTFEVENGSGDYAFQLVEDSSGGEVTSKGTYTAGASEGLDIVAVVDETTGERREAEIRVMQNPPFELRPGEVYLPVGQDFELRVEGGSGYLELQGDDPRVDFEKGAITAQKEGETTVTLADRFTGQTTDLFVRAVEPPSMNLNRLDATPDEVPIVADTDIDGDGNSDAVVGFPSSNLSAHAAGAVYIYRGTSKGYEPKPARIIEGNGRNSQLGRSLEVGDVTGDGLPDLVVGAPNDSRGQVRNGAVEIYAGEKGEFFSDAPVDDWSGSWSNNRLGYQVELCDYNGDGDLDIAATAPWAENRDAADIAYAQGSLHLYLSRNGTFLAKPDLRLYGKLPDGKNGKWSSRRVLLMGRGNLASGDFDDDGTCDLAVAAPFGEKGSADNEGFVFLYRGTAEEGKDPGGLELRPVVAWRGGERNARIGRDLSMGDLTGDGKAELVVGDSRYSSDGERRRGAVHVVKGRSLPDDTADGLTSFDDEVDWRITGESSWDRIAHHTQLADVDGDGQLDLLVANTRAKASKMGDETGTIDIYRGRDGSLPKKKPSWRVAGDTDDGRFGYRFGVAGDVDGSGSADLLAYARLGKDKKSHVGEPTVATDVTGKSTALSDLELPNRAAGSRAGASVDFLRDEGPGDSFLAVGATSANHDGEEDAGRVFLYRSKMDGFAKSPGQTLESIPTRYASGSDFGSSIADAGRFNDDGRPDLAVAAYGQTRRDNLLDEEFNDAFHYPGPTCSTEWSTGAVHLFPGTSGGSKPYESKPAFIFHGPQGGGRIQELVGGLDLDGDGRDDLLYSSWRWENSSERVGGFGVAYGRSRTQNADKTHLICEPDYTYLPPGDGLRLGTSLTGLGDLNGDGCDDFATGAPHQTERRKGRVWIVFGWNRQTGGTCDYDQPHGFMLGFDQRWSQLGDSLAGGIDLDGGGLPDLAVGTLNFDATDGDRIGTTWIVPGEYLRSLHGRLTSSMALRNLPSAKSDLNSQVLPLLPPGRAAELTVKAPSGGGSFSETLSFVPRTASGGPSLAVGAPRSDRAGAPSAGAVFLYRFDSSGSNGGIDPRPYGIFSGETRSNGSLLGRAIGAARIGQTTHLAVGAPWAHGFEADQGAAFAAPLR